MSGERGRTKRQEFSRVLHPRDTSGLAAASASYLNPHWKTQELPPQHWPGYRFFPFLLVTPSFCTDRTRGEMIPPKPGITTISKSGSESVQGTYLLHDRLTISTVSGSISITISAISDVNGPAELQLSSVSGSITVNMEHILSHPSDLPDRVIDTDIYSTSGSIGVSLIHNHDTKIKTTSGRIDARLYLGLGSPALRSQIQLANTSGATRMDLYPWILARQTPLRRLSTSFDGVSGSVDLTYPLTWEGDVEVRTVSGSLRCSDWPGLQIMSTGPKMSATVGKGEGEIWVRGTSNAVRLKGSHYGAPEIIEKMKDNENPAITEGNQESSEGAPPSYEDVMNMK